MDKIEELLRLPSPAPKPQSLAFDGTTLWMGSRETERIYAIDPAKWTAHDETDVPGVPWGMTVAGDELFVIYGVDPDDDRVVQRYIPGHGFSGTAFRAPEGTGSQLGWDGDVLYISQWYNHAHPRRRRDRHRAQRDRGAARHLRPSRRRRPVLSRHVDDEPNGPYWLTRVDARGATPVCEDLAIIPFPARALTFDGHRFWTNHREANEIVAFAHPAP